MVREKALNTLAGGLCPILLVAHLAKPSRPPIADIHREQCGGMIGRGAVPVCNATGDIRGLAWMQFLYGMSLHLGPRDPFFAQKNLSAFVCVPLCTSASFEMDAGRTHLRSRIPCCLAGEI